MHYLQHVFPVFSLVDISRLILVKKIGCEWVAAAHGVSKYTKNLVIK